METCEVVWDIRPPSFPSTAQSSKRREQPRLMTRVLFQSRLTRPRNYGSRSAFFQLFSPSPRSRSWLGSTAWWFHRARSEDCCCLKYRSSTDGTAVPSLSRLASKQDYRRQRGGRAQKQKSKPSPLKYLATKKPTPRICFLCVLCGESVLTCLRKMHAAVCVKNSIWSPSLIS